MRQIVLVKHAAPVVVPGKSSDHWPLSAAGREAATALAGDLEPFRAACVIHSVEPKAAETGQLLAAGLGIRAVMQEGLHEHERRTVPHLRTSDFLSQMAQVFKRKDELVLGEETASATLTRFRTAMDSVYAQCPEGNLIVVAHGTVIALFLESISQEDGYRIWREMGLPSYAVLDALPWRVVHIVSRTGQGK
jgi:broad specificity phosphatase PhoE